LILSIRSFSKAKNFPVEAGTLRRRLGLFMGLSFVGWAMRLASRLVVVRRNRLLQLERLMV
jgi:hypothetical protein